MHQNGAKTVPKWTKMDKIRKNQEKKIRKIDPRVQLRLEKLSFLVICRCRIGFFLKNLNFDPTVLAVKY